MSDINVWLDDVRPMPKEFDVNPQTAQDCIELLKTGNVKRISLDHDLGPEEAGTGYDVAKWIEENAFFKRLAPLEWSIHSDNPVGIQNMKKALESADRFWSRMSESVLSFKQFVETRNKATNPFERECDECEQTYQYKSEDIIDLHEVIDGQYQILDSTKCPHCDYLNSH